MPPCWSTGAGWHTSAKLHVPGNITLVPLPAKCPELNPQENVWQFMRENWLSNRIFSSYEDLLDHCCDAWNRLVEQPWRIMSLGLRDWAHGSRLGTWVLIPTALVVDRSACAGWAI
jgi:transposase